MTVLLLAAAAVAAQASQCPPATPKDVADTVQSMFDAAAADDTRAMAAILATNFYAFDGGERYSAATFEKSIVDFHRAGKRLAWQVTEPDVHIRCDTAWVTYVNRGILTNNSTTESVTWLESVQLVWNDRRWRIEFLQSTRVPAK